MNKITLGFFRTKSTPTIKTVFVLFAVLLMNTQTSWGQISITGTGIGNTYTQDFNLLATADLANAITTLPSGWTFVETLTNANTTYAAGDGSTNAANTFSYGTGTNTERAFGSLRSNALGSTLGVSFTNNSGTVISELVISYTGEQWRLGTAGRVDRLDFQYSLDATSLTTGAWTNVDLLDFTAPLISGALGIKDGNALGNKTSISNTITGLSIAPGATFWLRFVDFDTTGAEDGLAVDDFSMYAIAAPVITLSASTLTDFSATPTSPSSAQTINVSAANLTANVVVAPSLTNFEISTLPNSGFGPSITLTPVSGTVASTPIYVRIKSGVALGPVSEAVTFTSGTATQSLTCTGGVFTNYYYNGSGLLTDVASWDTDTSGIGANPPTNFTADNQLFEIRNTAAVALDGTWTVGTTGPVNGTKVRLGNNSEAAIALTLNSGASIAPAASGNFDVATPVSGNQTVIYKGTSAISFGNIFDTNLEVIYDAITQSSSSTKNFGTISLINGANVTFSATPVIKNINVDTASTLIAPTTNSSFITIPSGGSVTVNGTIRIPRQSGFVSSNLVTPNTTTTGTNIQFLGAENLTLGANSTVEYIRDAGGAQTITARSDYKNLTLGGTAPKTISGSIAVANNLTITNGPGAAAVILATNLTVGGSLTIASGNALTVNSASNLTVTGAITNSGTMTLANNANLLQDPATVVNTNTGAITVNRNSNPLFRLDYTMWSSPVSGSQTLSNFSPLTVSTRFYTFDGSLDIAGQYVATAASGSFTTGTGYLIRMPDTGSVDYVAGTETLTYPGQFTGTPNNGVVTVPTTSGLFYAIGNPYPSTISANTFITDNGIGDTLTPGDGLYFWRKTNDPAASSYATYTTAGGVVSAGDPLAIQPNGTIQVGQGFIVKATGPSLVFTNTMRTANNGNQILKTKVVERNRIWLNLSSPAGGINQMMLAYMSGATQGIDAAIDGRYFNDSPTALNSLVDNQEFAIQGRSLPFDGTDTVPLAFKTATAGNFTISIDHVDGLFSGSQDIYLVDSKTGTETNLKTSSYTFTAAAAVDNTRFSLKFQKTLSLDAQELNDNSVIVYKNGGVIYVNSGAKTINNIKVFDILGRVVGERNNVKANTASIQNLRASNQVLIVKVTTDDNQVISKKVEN